MSGFVNEYPAGTANVWLEGKPAAWQPTHWGEKRKITRQFFETLDRLSGRRGDSKTTPPTTVVEVPRRDAFRDQPAVHVQPAAPGSRSGAASRMNRRGRWQVRRQA